MLTFFKDHKYYKQTVIYHLLEIQFTSLWILFGHTLAKLNPYVYSIQSMSKLE